MDPENKQQDLESKPLVITEEHLRVLHDKELIDSLHDDIKNLAQLFTDMENLVSSQQSGIDSLENHIDSTKHTVVSAEKELKTAEEYQSSYNYITTLGFITLGTVAGAGLGSAGIFLGLKPALVTAVGGGIGFVSSLWYKI